MQTILAILKKAGGWHHGLHLHIDNPPYMPLVTGSGRRVGAVRTSRPVSGALRRAERRRHARPRNAFRGEPLGIADALLLAERLCSRRAVEPLYEGRQLLLSHAALRAASGVRQGRGTGTFERRDSPRRSTRKSTDAARPKFIRPRSGRQGSACAPQPQTEPAQRRAPCKTAAHSNT